MTGFTTGARLRAGQGGDGGGGEKRSASGTDGATKISYECLMWGLKAAEVSRKAPQVLASATGRVTLLPTKVARPR